MRPCGHRHGPPASGPAAMSSARTLRLRLPPVLPRSGRHSRAWRRAHAQAARDPALRAALRCTATNLPRPIAPRSRPQSVAQPGPSRPLGAARAGARRLLGREAAAPFCPATLGRPASPQHSRWPARPPWAARGSARRLLGRAATFIRLLISAALLGSSTVQHARGRGRPMHAS